MFRANLNCKPDNGSPSGAVYLPLARKYIMLRPPSQRSSSRRRQSLLVDPCVSLCYFLLQKKNGMEITGGTGVIRSSRVVTIPCESLPECLLAKLDACKAMAHCCTLSMQGKS